MGSAVLGEAVGAIREWSVSKGAGPRDGGASFGSLVFNDEVQQKLLPKNVYTALRRTITSFMFWAVSGLVCAANAAEYAGGAATAQYYAAGNSNYRISDEDDSATAPADAPYSASELALLTAWHLVRPFNGKKTANARAVVAVVHHLVQGPNKVQPEDERNAKRLAEGERK